MHTSFYYSTSASRFKPIRAAPKWVYISLIKLRSYHNVLLEFVNTIIGNGDICTSLGQTMYHTNRMTYSLSITVYYVKVMGVLFGHVHFIILEHAPSSCDVPVIDVYFVVLATPLNSNACIAVMTKHFMICFLILILCLLLYWNKWYKCFAALVSQTISL